MRLRAYLRRRLGRTGTERFRHGPVRAIWNGVVLAESDRKLIVEGSHYFLPKWL